MNPDLRDLLKPERGIDESFEAYRQRRRLANRAVSLRLRQGVPATHSRKGAVRYVNGPRRTHVAKFVTAKAWMLDERGVPFEKTFSVRHPGTLIREEI